MDAGFKYEVLLNNPDTKHVSLYSVQRIGARASYDLLLIGIPLREDGRPSLHPKHIRQYLNGSGYGVEFLLTDTPVPESTDALGQ